MKLKRNASSWVRIQLLVASAIRTETGRPTQPTIVLIWPFTEQTCWSLVQHFWANKACWKPQSFPSYNKSFEVPDMRRRNQYTFEIDRCILARRGVGRSGSTSSPAKKCRAQSPESLLSLLTSLPTGTPPPPSPSSATQAAELPFKSVTFWSRGGGDCSCRKEGIFILTLLPVWRLGGFMCWCLVLSFLVQALLTGHIRTEAVS